MQPNWSGHIVDRARLNKLFQCQILFNYKLRSVFEQVVQARLTELHCNTCHTLNLQHQIKWGFVLFVVYYPQMFTTFQNNKSTYHTSMRESDNFKNIDRIILLAENQNLIGPTTYFCINQISLAVNLTTGVKVTCK